MTDPTEDSNVVWLDCGRDSGAHESIANLEAELARERELLLRLMFADAEAGDLERCVELTQAMLAIARA